MDHRTHGRMMTGSTIFLRRADGRAVGDGQLFAEYGDGNVADLSRGGVHLNHVTPGVTETVVIGDVLSFHFNIPSGRIEGNAKVAWLRPDDNEMGLSFVSIVDAESRANMMAYLTSIFIGAERP
jgi:hypothetical protein